MVARETGAGARAAAGAGARARAGAKAKAKVGAAASVKLAAPAPTPVARAANPNNDYSKWLHETAKPHWRSKKASE